jgi:hypothetical protein
MRARYFQSPSRAVAINLCSMCWEKKCPLSAQLPVSASVVRGYDIVVGGDVGIDRLVTDLEDAPDAAADRHSPAIIFTSRPVGRDEGARVKYQPLGRL